MFIVIAAIVAICALVLTTKLKLAPLASFGLGLLATIAVSAGLFHLLLASIGHPLFPVSDVVDFLEVLGLPAGCFLALWLARTEFRRAAQK